jgi:hypothetical protein
MSSADYSKTKNGCQAIYTSVHWIVYVEYVRSPTPLPLTTAKRGAARHTLREICPLGMHNLQNRIELRGREVGAHF